MKDAAYVGVTTAVYREALDAAFADPEGYEVRPEWSARLEQSFSRSFTHRAPRGPPPRGAQRRPRRPPRRARGPRERASTRRAARSRSG